MMQNIVQFVCNSRDLFFTAVYYQSLTCLHILSNAVLCRYKERFQERRIKSLDPNCTMRFIDSKNWMFIKSGLDDFRNGVPPPATDDIFIKV